MTKTNKTSPATKLVTCMTCANAGLHQYGSNPVLAECHCQPQQGNIRFPYVIEVARIRRRCEHYTYAADKPVDHRPSIVPLCRITDAAQTA